MKKLIAALFVATVAGAIVAAEENSTPPGFAVFPPDSSNGRLWRNC